MENRTATCWKVVMLVFDELLQREHDRAKELILQGLTNKQVHEITDVPYRRICYMRSKISKDAVIIVKKAHVPLMRVGFWDEWELAVYRLFGGRKRVHLNP